MPETNGHSNGNPPPPSAGGNGAGGNGTNGGGGSKVASLVANAKAVQARAVEEIKETIKAPEKTDVWKSVLRVKHDDTP
ncbi:MAG TPA: hypothetical protein VH518_16260, partial [Tepidisphaeraceae bacterium]